MEVWGGNLRMEKHVQVPGLDVWLASRPLGDDQAGGDVYYVSSCAAGRLTRILLADVSGHGEQVACIAGQLRDLMRKNIEVADHRRLVIDMNRQFEAGTQAGTFATAVVVSFFAPTRSLLVCNAGHPAPLVYQRLADRWEYLDRVAAEVQSPRTRFAGLPLGILPHSDYEQRKVRLDRGDAVLCYTDAFIEAQRPDGSFLGTEGLLAIVAAASPFTDGADLMLRLIHLSARPRSTEFESGRRHTGSVSHDGRSLSPSRSVVGAFFVTFSSVVWTLARSSLRVRGCQNGRHRAAAKRPASRPQRRPVRSKNWSDAQVQRGVVFAGRQLPSGEGSRIVVLLDHELP